MINIRLIKLVKHAKKWIFLTVLMNWIGLLLNVMGMLCIAHYIQFTYDYGVSFKKSCITLVIFIGVISVRIVCKYMATKFSSKCSQDARLFLRNTIYKKLLDLGIHYQKMASTSEIVQVAIDGVERLEIYFGRYLPQFFYSLLAPFTLFIIFSFINLKVALVLFICVPLIPLSIIAIMKIANNLLSDYWSIYVNLGDAFLENLRGLTTLKIYDQDEERNEKMNIEAERFRKITMKVLAMQLNSINIMDLIAYGGSAIGIIMILKELKAGGIHMAGAFCIILLASEFFIPLRVLGSCFHVAMDGIAASEKIFKIIDTPVIKEETKEMKDFHNIHIAFEDISFSYEKNRKTLEHINLNIENGKITALAGVSGCGKSTIANMLMGFYKNYEGKILLNHKELRSVDPFQLRKKIHVVTNNSYIFTGTFEDNLKIGKATATEKEMHEALKKVNLYDFVMSLDKGLKSEIKEEGANLSGGQCQRLAFARALLYDSEIYIFDEATSNIDVESEEAIMKVIYELGKIKTVILISHRLYNVRGADRIYVLSKGKLKEMGNHEKLMDQKGVYFELVSEQNELEQSGVENYA
ncbi:ABC transporter ATP-binding protein/permease [Marinisporobacter balticus]|uniref:ATP-binding cassette subfamily C protein n=1 Tax=Marinisporobacter balticus TaxID=2018667 RepID=A0A4R2KQQ2_9FIRM|nr:ABC transporter ATP-binding protein/permease [Marinisporobacter balticus]TCO68925.1 ATP-binding cassette subfamily C protein [Marinisporobacter balticus]